MKLEKQVTSLKLSKKLKELGVKQESLFGWLEVENHGYKLVQGDYTNLDNYCSAFTVAELGEKLPKYLVAKRQGFNDKCDLVCTKMKDGWWITYESIALGNYLEQEPEKAEANARAKMLIYLRENNLIKK